MEIGNDYRDSIWLYTSPINDNRIIYYLRTSFNGGYTHHKKITHIISTGRKNVENLSK